MSYWLVEDAKIMDEGRSLEISFKDKNSIETMTIRMPAEHWKNHMVYRSAYEEPERRLVDAHKTLVEMMWNEARVLTQPQDKEVKP